MRAIVLLLTLLFAAACNGNKEMDNLSLAQNCLDNVSESNPQSATNCLQYTSGYSDQQAQLINCSIYLVAGGITTDRMASAYNVSQDNTVTNKTADYIAYLAFTTYASPADGYTAAQNAQSVCGSAGDAGLAFIADMAVVGSLTNELAGGLNLNGSTASIDTAVQNALASCETTPPAADCDPSVIGPVVGPILQTAATSYCATASADSSACTTINQAESSWGSDPTTLTEGTLCILQGKTFNPVGPTCT